MLRLIILTALVSKTMSKTCDHSNSLDITDGVHMPNGVINHKGVQYKTFEYYTDSKNTIRGCVCDKKICATKCCPLGHGYDRGIKECVKISEDTFNPPVLDEYSHLEDVNALEYFHFNILRPNCTGEVRVRVSQFTKEYHLRTDGKLYTEMKHNIPPWTLSTPDKYCVDTFILEDQDGTQTTSFDALICLAETVEKQHYSLSASCMLISCVFILATVGVYGWLPELRNLHGRVLMTYLMCLFVAFAFLATMQILLLVNNICANCCVGLTIVIYFSLESAFFWLNVMCFDIWWTFSGKRGMTLGKLSIKARFFAYALYAFGIPTVLTIIMVSLEFSGLPPHAFMPMIRRQGCFLYGRSRLIYLYGPIIVLWFANLIFFILTAVKITQIKKQTSVLKSRESATHDRQNSERQSVVFYSRLLLYVKLFLVMGINWLLEVISSLYPEAEYLWCFIDAYNVLIGLIIFIIFVCKRKIFRLMKKRIKESIQRQNGAMGSMTQIPHRLQLHKNLRDYKQRDSVDTIKTFCADSDSNKEINTTNL
ncbi:G-protein coupled receptor Mth-like isoform X3 [Maniola jurtina]|uniref:G-protein coupled receptor Mth-like isoform X3 n=1 Tax=Maniola jurtina TaxID=191418 RepID=UPI001E68869C|nr:G-protein coupled receptor Mth-like isoform X3 [Maniola jurtina]XP_045772418.1 G-protein coupled receptor Mth-like isoform X3 [Maniola jurtina]XP_045772419.1 G-protein coupled receptor Mth-like isoform X3 [Maniola jurtina]XP_045772420.1 G-protein coupled receptor Mth-like isoform X3 [Maniola jurtina]XP_045772422.1 G-protein coupled receptor Mth-like isoform X3 [Maniola jurtina]XP_045772423.1 G-protein coupled receptor Mth-like isoform X3 [Maniola jurtina]XP_045772424.1 G-protein coupled re